MRIVLATIGSRGDVEPAIAFALALRRAGHDVSMVLPPEQRGHAREYGLTHTLLAEDITPRLRSDGRRSPRDFLRALSLTRRHVIRQFDRVLEAAKDADVLACSMTFSPVALSLRDKRGTPACLFSLTPPYVRSRSTAHPWLPWTRTGGLANLAAYRIFEQLLWRPVRGAVNQWRRHRLGLPPLPRFGLYERLYDEPMPWLIALSSALWNTAADWPAAVQVTGPWFLEGAGTEPPEPLKRFVERDEKPICITFGSNYVGEPRRLLSMLKRALEATGQRAVLVGIDETFASCGDVGPRIFGVGSVSYPWLFPRVRFVVHHGGAGTTGHALRAGAASLVIPHGPDQAAFGRRLHELGVAPPPIRMKYLTEERLTEAMTLLLADERAPRAARALALEVGKEDGLPLAVNLVERLPFQAPARPPAGAALVARP